jgi:t-SNARE complex subunit (syntaxin)
MTQYNPLLKTRIEKQNMTIDLIEKGLNEFKETTLQIGEEFKEQDEKLDTLDKKIDRAGDQVVRVTNKTEAEMKYTKMCGDCGLIPVIIFLVIIIIIAIAFIIL